MIRALAERAPALSDGVLSQARLDAIAAERKALDGLALVTDVAELRELLGELAAGASLADLIAELPRKRRARAMGAS